MGQLDGGLEATVGGGRLTPQMVPVSCSRSSWTQWYAAYANMQAPTNECSSRFARHAPADTRGHLTTHVLWSHAWPTPLDIGSLVFGNKACLCMSEKLLRKGSPMRSQLLSTNVCKPTLLYMNTQYLMHKWNVTKNSVNPPSYKKSNYWAIKLDSGSKHRKHAHNGINMHIWTCVRKMGVSQRHLFSCLFKSLYSLLHLQCNKSS